MEIEDILLPMILFKIIKYYLIKKYILNNSCFDCFLGTAESADTFLFRDSKISNIKYENILPVLFFKVARKDGFFPSAPYNKKSP